MKMKKRHLALPSAFLLSTGVILLLFAPAANAALREGSMLRTYAAEIERVQKLPSLYVMEMLARPSAADIFLNGIFEEDYLPATRKCTPAGLFFGKCQ